MDLNFKTDALLIPMTIIGGWIATVFTSPILDWTRFCQGMIGILFIVGLTYVRFIMKDNARKIK